MMISTNSKSSISKVSIGNLKLRNQKKKKGFKLEVSLNQGGDQNLRKKERKKKRKRKEQ